MKKILLLIIFFIFVTSFIFPAYASDKDDFNKALSLYKNKEFSKAVNIFLDLYNKGYDNFEINYNIGCCYYNLNELGRARFYFEKSLFYKPFDSDLFHNLSVVYRKLLNNSNIGEQVVMNKRILFFIPMMLVIILLIIFIVLCFVFFILMYKLTNQRKLSLIFLTISFIFLLLFNILFFLQYTSYKSRIFVITSKQANIYVLPDESESILMNMPEGSSGKIIEEIDNYIRVKFNDDTSGWIKKDNIVY